MVTLRSIGPMKADGIRCEAAKKNMRIALAYRSRALVRPVIRSGRRRETPDREWIMKMKNKRKVAPTELASAAMNAIARDATLPRSCIVSVSIDGSITLMGEVERDAQREAAERQARAACAGSRVVNRIAVGPRGAQ